MKTLLRRWVAHRHLVVRWVRHRVWGLSGRFVARTKLGSLERAWVRYECAVVNHPTQQHLLGPKLHNMGIAVRAIDGLVLEPGEIFSFWRIVGRPIGRRGFHSGPTFENGQVVSSFGGGLCQISGLLFNLALESGCEILERHSHSLDAYGERRYLPLGRDATVAWLSKDLAFRNTTGFRLRLSIGVEPTRAYGCVESDRPMPFRIRIERSDFESPSYPHQRDRRAAKTERYIAYQESDWATAGTFLSEYRLLEPHSTNP